jgi:EpsI family protein
LFQFFRRAEVCILSALLIAQLFAVYGFSRQETIPNIRPLSQFPAEIGGWRMVQQTETEREIQDVLKADDLLNRVYGSPDGSTANLFIAYFRSQRTGKAPHSPKNCLPGSGWAPLVADRIDLHSAAGPARVNRYIVQKGDARSVVLYWYQSHQRVVASEYLAKIYLVLDSIRLNRSDTAIVRVVSSSANQESARAAKDFAEKLLPELNRQIP